MLAVTHETPFYGELNASLRSKNRSDVKPFFPWMKLMLSGLYKLPLGDASGSIVTVYRGVQGSSRREPTYCKFNLNAEDMCMNYS